MNTAAAQLAERFAAMLDRREYEALRDILSPDCRYEFRGQVVQGSAEVTERYRKNTEWGFAVFDRIEFESAVTSQSASSARVTFTDHVYCNGEVHHYRCQQIVAIDGHDRIHHIVHVDLDGERDALAAFFERCGIVPP